uniref:Retrovirus-related Pol polyprotein from transposon opus n=1 Tax=Cajanus cajan TaxID=3821 RepID=A0A151RQD6_CAJCA|nr:Retrovirus-related Pol polyprotein from transposon opus [Cajanus cajan]
MGYNVKRVLIDQGSFADILFWETFEGMKIPNDRLIPYAGTLVGFVGDQVTARGYADLETTFGQGAQMKTVVVRYLVVNAQSFYSILIGRPTLNKLGAVVSTSHLKVKYPLPNGTVGTLRVDQEVARKCYGDSLKARRRLYTAQVEQEVHSIDLDPRVSHFDRRPAPAEDIKEVTLAEGKKVKVGTSLSQEDAEKLIEVLKANMSAFAWHVKDMPGVDPDFMCHKLAIDPRAKPVIQKRRKFGEDKRKAITEETDKLLTAGFVREIQYPTWLANVVMVRKSSGKWRMCTDFTDLNKACPKDSYPLPNIDCLIDGATYQRLMDKVLMDQLGRNVEAYVDDMVVKSMSLDRHLDDLKELFETIGKYQLKLNPEKCSFGVQAGKFLGFLLTHRGIEANPEKCSAIINMRSPSTVKEVQQLTGRMASLSRFLYQKIEKLALAILVTARKLRHYFQSYEVIVRTDYPIRQVLQKPDLAGRMMKWSIELSEHSIKYEPRGAIKAQILADFVMELTAPVDEGIGAGIVLEGPGGILLEQSLRFEFRASNNQAEYEALLAGMALAKEMGATILSARSDSQLITGQVAGTFQAKDPQLAKYLEKVKLLSEKFLFISILC